MKFLKLKRRSVAFVAALTLINATPAAIAADSQQVINPPVAGAADALTIRKAFRLEKDPIISVKYRDIPVELVMRALAQRAGLNLVFMANQASVSSALPPTATAPVAANDDADAALMELESLTSGADASTAAPSVASSSSMMIPYIELNDIPLSEAFALVLQ